MSSDPDHDPKDDLKQGLSLLWRAARKTADDLRKDLDRSDVGKVIDDAGRELVRAASNVIGRISAEMSKPHESWERGKEEDGKRPEQADAPDAEPPKPPGGPTPEDPGFRIAIDPEDDDKPR